MMELPLNTLKRIHGWVKALHLPPLSGPLSQAAHIRLLTPSCSLSSASFLSFTHFNYRELLSYTVTIYRGCATYSACSVLRGGRAKVRSRF